MCRGSGPSQPGCCQCRTRCRTAGGMRSRLHKQNSRQHQYDITNIAVQRRTDEVEALAAVAAEVCRDEVDLAFLAADGGVEGAGPDLRVGGELVLGAADVEEQALQVAELGLGDREEPGLVVKLRTRRLLVRLECIGGEQEESGAGVDDARGAGEEDCRSAVGQVLVDAPVVRGGRGGGDWDIGDVARGPGKRVMYQDLVSARVG